MPSQISISRLCSIGHPERSLFNCSPGYWFRGLGENRPPFPCRRRRSCSRTSRSCFFGHLFQRAFSWSMASCGLYAFVDVCDETADLSPNAFRLLLSKPNQTGSNCPCSCQGLFNFRRRTFPCSCLTAITLLEPVPRSASTVLSENPQHGLMVEALRSTNLARLQPFVGEMLLRMASW
jgi:hypothetical protein